MSKYDGLGQYLEKQVLSEIPMTFAEIEKATGTKLPPKAQHQRAWWSNNPSNNVMTKIWLEAGYETAQVDMTERKLVFRRRIGRPPERNASSPTGLSEPSHMFKTKETENQPQKKFDHHPAWGALKGTFTIEPGYDLAQPVHTDEEWAEIEKEMEADWDDIEKGLSGGKK